MSRTCKLPTIMHENFQLNPPHNRMKTVLFLFITFHLPLFFNHCGLDVEDPTPPKPPLWVQKSFPEDWPERGVDAHESGGIVLEWQPNPEVDIVSYSIFRATWYENYDSLGKYEKHYVGEAESVERLVYVDNLIGTGNTYYYKIKAEDGAGNVSDYSDSINYTIFPQIALSGMEPNGIADTLDSEHQFSWRYDASIEMENYCLTILSETNEFAARFVFLPQTYTGVREYFRLPNENNLESGKIYKWRVDFGAGYYQGLETGGSESPWASFMMHE
jgi:hypothetical protein